MYKNKKSENIFKKWDDYALDIPSDSVKDIKKFFLWKVSFIFNISSHVKNLKPFRLTKKNEATEVFEKIEENKQNDKDRGESDMEQ